MVYRLKHGLSCTYVDNFYRYEKIEDIDRKSFDGQTPPVFQATVQAPDGCLWIAKFPSKHDETDSGAWDMVVHDLAELCGLNVPQAKAEKFSRNGTTFLVKRFD